MADRGIVQKAEIVVVHSHCGRVRRKREREIRLLSDCFDLVANAKVREPTGGFLMKRFIAILLTVTAIGAATPAFAQESAPGPGKVVITIIPAGATFFTEADDNTLGPSFGSYDLGGSVAVNFNRYVGLEGEVSGALGVSQSLQVGTVTLDERSPDLLELQRQPRHLRAESFVGGAVPHRWCGRPDDVRAAHARR